MTLRVVKPNIIGMISAAWLITNKNKTERRRKNLQQKLKVILFKESNKNKAENKKD